MLINYDIRKRPYVLILFFVNLILIAIISVLYIFKVNVLGLLLIPISSLAGAYYFRKQLLFDYQFLKWYERMIKKTDRHDDVQFFANQVIEFSIKEDNAKIYFKKMGYYKEEDLKKLGILISDFFPKFEFSKLEELENSNVLHFTPKRERIDLKKTQILDLVFPANAGYKTIPTYQIDSGLVLKLGHTVISGKSGSGKSVFIQKYYYPVLERISDFHIIDIKNTTPDEWKNKANSYTNKSVEGLHTLELCKDIMNQRYDKNQLNEKPIVLVFEEVQAFKLNLTTEQIKDFNNWLKQILVLGREAGVYIFFVSQTVNIGKDGVFDSAGVRDQFQVKYNLGEISMEQSQQIFGVSSSNLPKRFDSSPGSGYIKLDDEILPYRTPLA